MVTKTQPQESKSENLIGLERSDWLVLQLDVSN